MERKELGCTTEDLAHAPFWRFAEWPLLGSLPARGPFTSKTSAHSFFHLLFPSFLCSQLAVSSLKHVQCPPSDFFGAVNPERDLNFKEQLPRRRTCRLNAPLSLAADETDSVCRLLTLLGALFATHGMCACLLTALFLFIFYFFQVCTEAGPVIGNHLTL